MVSSYACETFSTDRKKEERNGRENYAEDWAGMQLTS